MLYATYIESGSGARQCAREVIYGDSNSPKEFSGHINDFELKNDLNCMWPFVTAIQASGDELVRCCQILGRPLPYTCGHHFLGDNAREIAINW